MAPNVTVHFFEANDINGTPLLEITDEDEYFQGLKLTPDLWGLGGWELQLARNINFALFSSGAVQPEVFVRFLIHAWSDTKYFYGGVLQKRNQDVIDRDEAGAETFVFGGPGPKQYMERYRLGTIQLSGGGSWLVNLDDGVWRFNETATAGRVLNRLTDEDAAAANPALPDLTVTFDQTDDSDGNPWTDEIATDGTFELPIGNSLLQTIWDLEDLADLYTTVELGTVSAPLYELNAYETYGDDNSGTDPAADVCILREGLNIANDSLTVTGVAMKKASHVIIEGKDGAWATTRRPSWSSGDYVKWEKIEYARSSSVNILEKAGLRWLQRQTNAFDQLTVEIVPGASPSTGFYFPKPDGLLWTGNTITLDTVADGSTHSPLDYNNSPQLVTGLEIVLGPAGDDSTADKEAKSWDVKVKLNGERGGFGQSPNQQSAVDKCRCGGHTHFPPTCPVAPGDTLITDSDDSGWLGTLTGPDTDGFTGFWRSVGGSGGTSSPALTASGLSAGDYRITVTLGGSEHKYTGKVQIRDSTGSNPAIDETFPNAVRAPGGHGTVTAYSYDFELPTGYDRIRYFHASKMGGWRYQGEIYALAGTPPDPGNCMPEGSGEEGFPPRYDDPRFDTVDQHVTTRLSNLVINNSGGTLSQGQWVVHDNTTVDSVITTSTAAQADTPVGMVLEGGADGEEILVAWEGILPGGVYTGSPAPDEYLYTSTTPGSADSDAALTEGAFAQVGVDGTDIKVHLWGMPIVSGSGVTDHGDLTGLPDDDHPQYLRTTLGGRDVINTVAAAGSTETLSLATANVHDVTLSADCTLTLAGATNGVACTMNILLRQGSGAPWLVTWPGSVDWVGGSAPTLQTAEDEWNWVTLITLDGGTVWFGEAVEAGGGGGGAPTTADYLVGTAQGGLSAEIVVGTTPGGELGGTWASPTVDSTHSGSAHHAQTHATSHSDGGADQVSVLNLDGYTGSTSNYLRADGTFATPSGSGTGNVETGGSAITIPDLLNNPSKAGLGGGGITEEYDTSSTNLTWGSAPTTEDSNTTIPSALFYENTQNGENLGLRSWAPGAAAAFDCRLHIGVVANDNANAWGAGLIVTSSGSTSRAMIHLTAVRAGHTVQAFTYAAGSYTQRGGSYGNRPSDCYLRITRDGSNNVSFWWSDTGYLWNLVATQSFTFTPANIGYRMSTNASVTLRMQSNFLRTTT